MSDFPLPPRDLPFRISPCPILEAILELRFVTTEDWSVLPGLLYARVRERYPEKRNLPLADVPGKIRAVEPALVHKPLVQFSSDRFIVQLGPRVVSLLTKGEYPGWKLIQDEMGWLLSKLKDADFISEGERLGMRYIDFFQANIFEHVVLSIQVDGKVDVGQEMNFTRVFQREDFKARLMLSNGALIRRGDKMLSGSILDLDLWIGASQFDLFETVQERFSDAHRLNKEIFFGLLTPEFLAVLSPKYV